MIVATSKLKKLLDNHKIKYVAVTHSTAYTIQEVAESAHIPGHHMAKPVIVDIDRKLAMVVIPGNKKIDLEKLKKFCQGKDAHLATENEFKDVFKDCEVGAMPPFGHLYGLDVYLDDELSRDEEIAFNSGTHSEVIKMKYKDFEMLSDPIHGSFI